MKKLLSTRFKVYLIDEYNTSKLHNKNTTEGDNLIKKNIYKNKKTGQETEVVKKIHSILTFKMSDKRRECINRDYNATLTKVPARYFSTSG